MRKQRGLSGKVMITIFAALCAVFGLMPHLFFAYQVSPDTFYQGAWDEAFYILTIYNDLPNWNDYPIKQALGLLVTGLEPEKQIFALSMDVVFPMIIVISAGALARCVTRSPAIVVAFTFLLVFGTDILGLNSTVANFPNVYLSQWLREGTLYERQFTLDALATYLRVFRTPEPQLSLSFLFLHMAALISFILRPKSMFGTVIPLLVTSLLCAAVYSFISLAAISFSIFALIATLAGGQRDKALPIIIVLLVSIFVTGFVLLYYYSKESAASLFNSRLPVISPGIVYGLLGISLVFFRFRARALREPHLLFSLALLIFPLVALNQQVLTGVMVQTLSWERFVNIPAIITALALAFGAAPVGLKQNEFDGEQQSAMRSMSKAKLPYIQAGIVLVAISAFIIQAQIRTYQQWLQYNVQTQAYALAMDSAQQGETDQFGSVILDKMQMDAAILARSKSPRIRIHGYSWIVTTAFGADTSASSGEMLKQQGYEVASRLGLDAGAYQSALQKELSGNYCWPHMMYLVDFLECAPYVSDFRKYNVEKLEQLIERSVKEYKAFLATESNTTPGAVLLLSSTSQESGETSGDWSNELLSTTEVIAQSNWLLPGATAKVFAYRQTRVDR